MLASTNEQVGDRKPMVAKYYSRENLLLFAKYYCTVVEIARVSVLMRSHPCNLR